MVPQEMERYTVTASFLNVRKNASAKATIVGGLKKGDMVDVYGFEGNWAEIGYKDGKAFVYMEHIEKVDIDKPKTQRADPSITPMTEPQVTLTTNWSIPDIQDPKKKKRHKDDGFRWYEYVYEVDVEGSTKVLRAAFNSDEEQITPILEANELSYTDGFFEVNVDGGHALYDKVGNCIIPSSYGFNMIYIHSDNGMITAYNSSAREDTEKTFSMDGRYYVDGDCTSNLSLFDSNKKPISAFAYTNTSQEISLAPKKPKELSSETDSDDHNHNHPVVQEVDDDELERWENFFEYVEEGDKYFTNKHYAKAAKSYKKALKYQTDASVWFNLGLAQYSNDQFKMAKKSFTEAYEEALSNGNNPQLANRALEMKNRSAELAKEKSKQGWLTAAAITLAVVDVAAITYANYELQKNPYVYTPSYNGSTNNNYLLDPNYAIWQTRQQQAQMDAVQQQLIEQTVKQTEKDMEEFNRIQAELINLSIQQTAQQEYDTYLLMTSGGTSMSFEEWKAIRWQSVAQEAMNETYNEDFNFEINIDENKYKGKLSPEQYREAYRSWENSAQGHYNALTIGGARNQDSQGNIKGQTVGQMAGGSYTTHKQGLTKAQNEMKRIRQEASQYGVNIPQSNWETATAGY